MTEIVRYWEEEYSNILVGKRKMNVTVVRWDLKSIMLFLLNCKRKFVVVVTCILGFIFFSFLY